eukprot:Blabericola_migrator_1__5645@NODE_2869_length_2262_cov_192_062870_g1800_i0_p1_GENE_NODE_2869_length_2262_cov_192_062870_g1800_i0NODE_2869_length_2262_cov_192_062870_g1800_i0_p1_ORF_typecomplete_len571_score77_14Hat1_N/PF10394_9/1_8e06Acetyltransf_10/PF13673_7/0_00042Acetyltransf_1/PF00583_25/0_00059Acetyltransf_7/PF13508_7/0_0032DUF2380/PF09533_10/1_1DUF2380/PF09533_10/1_8e02MGTL/PF17059_5/27MGTL/PF17059_5/48_NODE_2869_length_2262_cov_192_062870_g1800_i01251837
MATLTPARFLFHSCLSEKDFVLSETRAKPATYIHHFFPEAYKQLCHPSLRIHIFYIPIRFDVHIHIEGKALWDPLDNSVPLSHPENAPVTETPNIKLPEAEARAALIDVLEKSQKFPGGFIRSPDEFRRLLQKMDSRESSRENSRETDQDSGLEPACKKMKLASGDIDPRPIKITGRPIAKVDHNSSYFWVIEVSLPPFNEAESDFAFVHRRIEWFMHFYIDAMSNIHLDPRWRIFVALRFISQDHIDQLRLEEENIHNHSTPPHTLAALVNRYKDEADSEHYKEAFFRALEDESTSQCSLRPSPAIDSLLSIGSQHAEILGLVTVYQFFALPKDRARISQFFIIPNHQRAGIGQKLLMTINEYLCCDNNIRQITVEDPAIAFQRVRDVCSISLAIQLGILRPEYLYCPDESGRLKSLDTEWPQYSLAFRYILKETPSQRRRIKLILKLARLIPRHILHNAANVNITSTPVSKKRHGKGQYMDTDRTIDTKKRRFDKEEENNELIEWQKHHTVIKDIRIKEKQRFRLESIEWYSQKRTLSEIQGELENEWRSLFKSLCAALRSLRNIYPL